MTGTPPHEHPGRGSEDIDVSRFPDLSGHHVALRFGEVGEDSGANAAPYIPLSLTVGERTIPANSTTIRYGLHRDFWVDPDTPSEADRQALLQAALGRLPADMEALARGDISVLEIRHFVLPQQP